MNQALTSMSCSAGCSPNAGTSGVSGERLRSLVPSGTTLPALMNCRPDDSTNAPYPVGHRRSRQRTDTAAEGGVRDMPRLGCAHETALTRQRNQVFEELHVHRALHRSDVLGSCWNSGIRLGMLEPCAAPADEAFRSRAELS